MMLINICRYLSIIITTCGLDINIPVQLHPETGENFVSLFSYSTSSFTSLESTVTQFCDNHNIRRQFCVLLFSKALEDIISNASKEDQIKFSDYDNSDEMNALLGAEDDFVRRQLNGKSEWAYYSERLNEFRSKLLGHERINIKSNNSTDINSQSNASSLLSLSSSAVFDRWDSEKERNVDKLIFSEFTEKYVTQIQRQINRDEKVYSGGGTVARVCFIHACTLPDRDISILLEMLDTIIQSGLRSSLTKLWILNHGTQLSAKQKQLIYQKFEPHTSIDKTLINQRANGDGSDIGTVSNLSVSPLVSVVERSSDMTRFEVTTLRHLYQFSSNVIASANTYEPSTTTSITSDGTTITGMECAGGNTTTAGITIADVQILYLHTKGITYKKKPAVHDWRRLMMYFMVEKYQQCFHLLASQLFDVIGTQYVSRPRFFNGNFWWASAKYITQKLKILSPDARKVHTETWILNSNKVRIYDTHSSGIDHYQVPYPREMYDGINGDDDVDRLMKTSLQTNVKENKHTLIDNKYKSAYCIGYQLFNIDVNE